MSARFVTMPGGYVVDRRIGQIVSLFLILLAGLSVGLYGWKTHVYVSCPEGSPGGWCANPFYDRLGNCAAGVELCRYERIPAGVTVGERPSSGPFILGVAAVGIVAAGALANHFMHNQREVLRWKY